MPTIIQSPNATAYTCRRLLSAREKELTLSTPDQRTEPRLLFPELSLILVAGVAPDRRMLVWVPDLERLVTIKTQEEEDVTWCLWRQKHRAISYFGLPQNRRNVMNYVFILKYSNLPHTIRLLIKSV